MKKAMLVFSLLASLAVAGCGASNKTRREGASTSKLSQRDSAEVDEKTDVECRWIVPTGSSLRKRVCKSRFEWEMEKQSARDFLQRPRAGPQTGQ